MKRLLDNTCLTTAALYCQCVFTSISSLNESVKPQFKEPVEAQIRLPGSFIHSFKDLYKTSSTKLLRGAPDSSTVKKNSIEPDCPVFRLFVHFKNDSNTQGRPSSKPMKHSPSSHQIFSLPQRE